MKLLAKQNRELIMINAQNTQNENDAEKIILQVPEKYEDFNKKIVFVTPDGNVWDIITNNEYLIKKAITKYKQVDFYIWLTKGDVDFRSQTKTLKFYHNVDASNEITDEEIGRVNTVVNLLEEEITKVDNIDINAEKVDNTTTITITDKDGKTKSVEILDGEKGDKGDRGDKGISPSVEISKNGKVTTITITDSTGPHKAIINDGLDGKGVGDMNKSVYDKDDDGIVDNSKTVNGHTVESNVPANAQFTDTIYDDSYIKENIQTNATNIETIKKRVDLLEDIQSMEELSWKQIQAIVQAGKASTYFKIGDQIITKWKDTYANKEYEVSLDVVSFEDVTINDNGTEKIVPGMVLQWHYCSPFGVQFSQNQAFYHCNEPLPAGKYYFTIGDNWGSHCHKDYKYEFETTQTIPAGGQILIGTASSETSAMPDNNPSNWRIRTYSSPDSTTPLEILTLTKNDTPTGTFLGTLSTSTKYNTTLNNLYSSAYGNTRWKNSALRQYLNSAEDAGNWFVLPDDVFARKPDQLSNKNGFLSGVDSELLSVIKAVKVSTAINTNRDSEIGIWDYTYDKFFIPSMEQIYCNPQITGEGKYWEYWKIKSGLSSPNAQWSTNPNMITYAVENHSSAQYVRLRSANRFSSNNTWTVSASGSITSAHSATTAIRFSPACVIC